MYCALAREKNRRIDCFFYRNRSVRSCGNCGQGRKPAFEKGFFAFSIWKTTGKTSGKAVETCGKVLPEFGSLGAKRKAKLLTERKSKTEKKNVEFFWVENTQKLRRKRPKKHSVFGFPQPALQNFSNFENPLSQALFSVFSTARFGFFTYVFHHFSTGVEKGVEKRRESVF